MGDMRILQLVMTGLWTMVDIALAVVFIVKYRSSATGILGAIGAIGKALTAMAIPVVFPLVTNTLGASRLPVIFGVVSVLDIMAYVCIFVAVLLAPGLRQAASSYIAQPWTPPPAPQA